MGVGDDWCHPLWRATAVLTVAFVLLLWYEFIGKTRPLSLEEIQRAKQQRKDAIQKRLARVPEDFGKRRQPPSTTKPKVKIQLPEPAKFLPKIVDTSKTTTTRTYQKPSPLPNSQPVGPDADTGTSTPVVNVSSSATSCSGDAGVPHDEKEEEEELVDSLSSYTHRDQVPIQLEDEIEDEQKAALESMMNNSSTDAVHDEESTLLQQALFASLAQTNHAVVESESHPPTGSSSITASTSSSSTTTTNVGFHHIPGLPNEEYAEFLLKRLAKEFIPIIQRRGYNVMAVSE